MATAEQTRSEHYYAPVDCQFREASHQLSELAESIHRRKPTRRAFERAEAALAALPLSPNDFVIARGRVRHAKRLVWLGELSAASGELNLVADCLYSPD